MADRVHLVDDDEGRPLCEAMVARDGMDDAEFWDDVFNPPIGWGGEPLDRCDDEDFNIPPDVAAEYELEQRLANPCPECGQVGACSYDVEGRALIHVNREEPTDA